MLLRLKQLDEANGHTAVVNGDEHTDNGLVGDRTGHVHAAAKQDIVNQWLQGSLDNVSPSGQINLSPFLWVSQSLHYHACNACDVC